MLNASQAHIGQVGGGNKTKRKEKADVSRQIGVALVVELEIKMLHTHTKKFHLLFEKPTKPMRKVRYHGGKFTIDTLGRSGQNEKV